MKTKTNYPGQIRVYWVDEKRYSVQTFCLLDPAITYVESIRGRARLELDGRVLGYWDRILGFQPTRKAILEIAPVLRERKRA